MGLFVIFVYFVDYYGAFCDFCVFCGLTIIVTNLLVQLQFLDFQVYHVLIDGTHHAIVEASRTIEKAKLEEVQRKKHPQGPTRHTVQYLL